MRQRPRRRSGITTGDASRQQLTTGEVKQQNANLSAKEITEIIEEAWEWTRRTAMRVVLDSNIGLCALISPPIHRTRSTKLGKNSASR